MLCVNRIKPPYLNGYKLWLTDSKLLVIVDLMNGCTALAEKTGISKSHASLVLRGKRQPSITVCQRMAKALGVSVDEFLRQTSQKRVAAA